MKEDEVVMIASYQSIIEANLAKELIELNNIPCFLQDENIVQLYPMFTSPFGGIKLYVLRKDEEQVMEILQNNNLI
jgi:hypothetical protein